MILRLWKLYCIKFIAAKDRKVILKAGFVQTQEIFNKVLNVERDALKCNHVSHVIGTWALLLHQGG